MKTVKFLSVLNTLGGTETIDRLFASQFCTTEDEASLTWFMLLMALSALQRQGHTCVDVRKLANTPLFVDETQQLNGWCYPAEEQLEHAIEQAMKNSVVASALVYQHGRLYTRRYWQFEREIGQALAQRCAPLTLSDEDYARLNTLWPGMFSTDPTAEQDWQQLATACAVQQRFTVISGGPGTGKTYTVTRLLLALQCVAKGRSKIQLAAPTGKAAQRMNESIAGALEKLRGHLDESLINSVPTDAVTLHRLLGISRFGVETRKNQANPLQCDVLIVDEASMIDMALMARVVRALPAQARLILVGDADQLPAVESGNVLEALVEGHNSELISAALQQHLQRMCPHLPVPKVSDKANDYVKMLHTSRRFGGDLATVATAIKANAPSAAWQIIRPAELPADITANQGVLSVSDSAFEAHFVHLVRQCFSAQMNPSLTPAEALQQMARCRWLSPVRNGEWGVNTLNQRIEQALQVAGGPLKGGHYAGRPVMVVENHYAQGLFNGDVGIIWPAANGQLKAWFDTDKGLKTVSLSRLPAVETVFAMTVHKSQGSEFEHVVMLMPAPVSSHIANLCSRELLYTGLTRAKAGCILVGDESRFTAMVGRQQQRYSGLAHTLHTLAGQAVN